METLMDSTPVHLKKEDFERPPEEKTEKCFEKYAELMKLGKYKEAEKYEEEFVRLRFGHLTDSFIEGLWKQKKLTGSQYEIVKSQESPRDRADALYIISLSPLVNTPFGYTSCMSDKELVEILEFGKQNRAKII